jgi:hypothetical protein
LQIRLSVQFYKNLFTNKLSVKTSSQRLKPDSYQRRRHKNDRLAPDFRETSSPPVPTTGAIIACLYFLLPESLLSELNFNFSVWHKLPLVRWIVTDIGCHIKKIFPGYELIFSVSYAKRKCLCTIIIIWSCTKARMPSFTPGIVWSKSSRSWNDQFTAHNRLNRHKPRWAEYCLRWKYVSLALF